MRRIAVAAAALALAAFVSSCASKPSPVEEKPKGDIKVEQQVYPPKVIEHKTSSLGGSVPDWVFMTAEELENLDKYKDTYVFVFDQVGRDLEGVKAWTRSFSAATEVARMVSTRVMDKFAGAQVGDKDKVETYMEEVAKVLAQAQYSGARKQDDFWVYQQTYKDDGRPDRKLYRYWLLYTVPKGQIDAAIDRALEEAANQNKPRTEEEQTAQERVKEVFSSGLD